MQIKKTIDFLNDYRTKLENKKNWKHAEKFVHVLEELRQMDFNASQIERLNSELLVVLKTFEIQKDNIGIRYELRSFLKFLRAEYSIIPPNYNLYIGLLVGVLVSAVFGIISASIGLVMGAAVGYLLDDKAAKEKRRLKTPLDRYLF